MTRNALHAEVDQPPRLDPGHPPRQALLADGQLSAHEGRAELPPAMGAKDEKALTGFPLPHRGQRVGMSLSFRTNTSNSALHLEHEYS